MKIIVCVKQTLDTAAKVEIKDGSVHAPGAARIMNPYDEFAVEEAKLIKDRHPETEILAISIGPNAEVLKSALAMADRALHLCDPLFDSLEGLGIAHVLSKAIERESYDLILCGRQAVDWDRAQAGPALAVFLGIPCVSVVTRLEFSEDYKRATATRQIEGGSEILECPLPLLLTCQKGLNLPRLPSLKGIMAAKKKTVEVLTAADLQLASDFSQGFQFASAAELALPPAHESAHMVQGEAADQARELVALLRNKEKVV